MYKDVASTFEGYASKQLRRKDGPIRTNTEKVCDLNRFQVSGLSDSDRGGGWPADVLRND